MVLEELNMKEKWVSIKGYEDIYEVSDKGNVRTVKDKTTYTEMHGVRVWKQKQLKFRGHSKNTGNRVSLWLNGKPKDFLVARLVAFNFYGKDITDRSLTVNHIDGNRFNNNLENLELISLADNIRHAFETGLMTTCKKVTLKKNDFEQTFISLSKASKFLGKSTGYLSEQIKKGKTMVGDYEIILHN